MDVKTTSCAYWVSIRRNVIYHYALVVLYVEDVTKDRHNLYAFKYHLLRLFQYKRRKDRYGAFMYLNHL